MYVRRLELHDFRSYAETAVDFDPGPSVLIGPNGHGKTNLVEAIGYVATLGSHRVATEAPLVRYGAQRAVIRCAIVHDGRELLVELEITPGRANRARIGRAPATRARDVLGALRLVLFAPEDLALVRGDPAERRRYLDDLLVQRQPRLAGVRADYERVLKQRNALLRTAYLARKVSGRKGRPAADVRAEYESNAPDVDDLGAAPLGGSGRDHDPLSTLDVWDVHLAAYGADLVAARLELCAALGTHVAKAYDAVSAGRGEARLAYEAKSWAAPVAEHDRASAGSDSPDSGVMALDRSGIEQRLRAALVEARPSEVERGVTLVGPHRDDLTLTLGELPAKGYASHGESWSFALALRLASYELLRGEGIEPVLVLDDVFAELDTGRRERLADLVAGASQVIVTCAVPQDVPEALSGARYTVGDGSVSRVD
ncbi:MAG TPA: DNA replication/repair protein RecF [Jiangellales bacterium]|nr:DNA replication/repair protein RecF [Jiangellales bacterium]